MLKQHRGKGFEHRNTVGAYGDAFEMLKYERVTPKALPNLIQPTRYTRSRSLCWAACEVVLFQLDNV